MNPQQPIPEQPVPGQVPAIPAVPADLAQQLQQAEAQIGQQPVYNGAVVPPSGTPGFTDTRIAMSGPAPAAPMPGTAVAPMPAAMTQPVAMTGGQAAVPLGPNGKPLPVKGNQNSTQNALEIAEIRDGIVIMNDGSFRSVVMLKSINFDLMSPQEQEAIEYSYQGFLNSLYFPVQIFIRSQRVDLQPYIEKLDKIRTEHDNMLLALLMQDYIGYIDQISRQANIMDKKFYIVIPFFPHEEDVKKAALDQSKNFITGLTNLFAPKEVHVTINEADLEAGKTELRNRVQALLSGLLQCSIQGLPLDTQELIELYYDTYNPDTATRQELKNFDDLTADIITKGQGAAQQQHLQRELQ